MKILVVGAGVIGVTSAYALAKAGHQVTVVERLAEPAMGTSFANAGQISPALSAPWNTPGLTAKALKWMRQTYPPLVIGKVPDTAMLGWLWRFYRAANETSYDRAKKAMVALGEYSRDCLHNLLAEEHIAFGGRRGGTFVLFRKAAQAEAYARDLDALAELDVPARRVGLDELSRLEPNLATDKLCGAVHLPGDETGDCHAFTKELAAAAQRLGVSFVWNGEIARLKCEGQKVVALETSQQDFEADAYVVAAGVYSTGLLAPLGVRLPIYPVKGYSLTIAADSDALGPISTVSDETYKIGVTSFGSRVRVGGTAELSGYSLTTPKRRFAGLRFVARDLFPRLPDQAIENAQEWSGLRPMTAAGPPVIGRTPYRNLFVNAGHGTLGWTMAMGSAALLASLIEERPPALPPEPYANAW